MVGLILKPMRHLILSLSITLGLATLVSAYCEVDVSNYVGYQIIHSGTVTGYIDDDGVQQDDFEGCDWGRKLIIDHSLSVTCATYSYSYSYYPDIVILSSGNSMVACIDNEMYDVQR